VGKDARPEAADVRITDRDGENAAARYGICAEVVKAAEMGEEERRVWGASRRRKERRR
jgi:hypothetical protein